MKNINKTWIVIGIMLLSNISYAQRSNWTLGFNMGYKIQMLEKTTPSDLNIKSFVGDKRHSGYPTIGLSLTYSINERFFISSGFSYLEYNAAWKMGGNGIDSEKWIGFAGGNIWFRYLQIPLNVKYAIPLGKSNFSVYGKLGFSFDILVDLINNTSYSDSETILYHEDGSEQVSDDLRVSYFGYHEYNYKHTAETYDKKLNILLNAGIGFGYRFRNGLGLFIEGEYYAGLRTMGHVFIEATPVAEFPSTLKDYSEHLLIKGNYWNFNLGITYTFKKN